MASLEKWAQEPLGLQHRNEVRVPVLAAGAGHGVAWLGWPRSLCFGVTFCSDGCDEREKDAAEHGAPCDNPEVGFPLFFSGNGNFEHEGWGIEAGVDLAGGGRLAVAVILRVGPNKTVVIHQTANREAVVRAVERGFPAEGEELRGVLLQGKLEGQGRGVRDDLGVYCNNNAMGVLRAAGHNNAVGRGVFRKV